MSHDQRERNLCLGAKAALTGGSAGAARPGPGLQRAAEGTEPSGESIPISPLASLLVPKQQWWASSPCCHRWGEVDAELAPGGSGRGAESAVCPSDSRAEVVPQRAGCGALELVPSCCPQRARVGHQMVNWVNVLWRWKMQSVMTWYPTQV